MQGMWVGSLVREDPTCHGATKPGCHKYRSLCDALRLVAQTCPTLCDPVDCSPPGSSVHGILQARILEWVAMLSSRDLPNPGIKPRSPALQAGSLPSEPPGKPKNTWVGSLPLLQGILWDPGIELGSPAFQAGSLPAELPGNPHGSPWAATNKEIKREIFFFFKF